MNWKNLLFGVAAAVAGFVVVAGMGLLVRSGDNSERESRINSRLQRVVTELDVALPAEVVSRVYDCKAARELTPCPDYVASYVIPEAPFEKPQVTPALTTQGATVIGLEPVDLIKGCADCRPLWAVEVKPAPGVVVFATSRTFNGNWTGPKVETLKNGPLTGTLKEPGGVTVEIYAVSTDPGLVGKPLADARLGG